MHGRRRSESDETRLPVLWLRFSDCSILFPDFAFAPQVSVHGREPDCSVTRGLRCFLHTATRHSVSWLQETRFFLPFVVQNVFVTC